VITSEAVVRFSAEGLDGTAVLRAQMIRM
jgi:hypothetical protein